MNNFLLSVIHLLLYSIYSLHCICIALIDIYILVKEYIFYIYIENDILFLACLSQNKFYHIERFFVNPKTVLCLI